MEHTASNTVMQVQIRKVIDDRVSAVRRKDATAVMSLYDDDVVSFDVVGELAFKGRAAVKSRLEAWFGGFKQDNIGFDITDIHLNSSEDMAFCYSLNHVHGMVSDGHLLDMWWRETTCYKRIEGKWLIVHAHNSVPFNMQTGKPSLDLKPS